ncbi:MAG TPA: two-component regulator propeller domain-containing protein [Terriglobales bacterium]|nr:two-component regulator propeller domain-containing protein [Terriglobales bacterium]
MMKRTLFSLTALLIFPAVVFAGGTRTWFQSRYDDFSKGTAKGVAIRSNGTLELSPALKQVATTPSTYFWALASDREGNAYIASGSPARVYRVTPQGQVSIIFEPQELQVQALLFGRDGALYAATSPDGKVYRITRNAPAPPAGKTPAKAVEPQQPEAPVAEKQGPVAKDPNFTSSVFFDPKTKYIWALAEDNDGRLYVATGDRGEIYRVDKTGNGSVFFKSDEAHIRALAFDPRGNLIAGSDGSGLIYRISPAGDGFVLYSAPKKEITAIAVDRDGNIYAAGAGEKRTAAVTPTITLQPQTVTPIAQPQPGAAPTVTLGSQVVATPVPQVTPVVPITTTGGSEVYRIAPDGSPRRLWQSRDELVYVLAFDPRGRLIAGTGNRGRLFVISGDSFTDLGKATANQVTGIAPAPNGGVYIATSNLGKLFLLGGTADADGTFESDVFDARIFSRWGRAVVRGTGNFELFARSGNVDNPDRNWSDWKKVDLTRELPMEVPPARFVQWRAVLHPGNPPATLDSVLVNYLPKNVPPQVDEVYVQPGARFPQMPRTSGDSGPIAVGPGQVGVASRVDAPVTALRDKEYVAVRWVARDENDDDLSYSVYYRGDNETRWKLLKSDLTDKYFSFESALLPDGGYKIMVTASDAPSHTPEEALSDSKESPRFEIDTTPPQVTNVTGVVEGDTLHITFRALDGYSPIARAEYSIDAGEWQTVEPVGQISDYRVQNYDFNIKLPSNTQTATEEALTASQSARRNQSRPSAGQEHVIVVRVYDRFDNMGSAKTVIPGR